MGRGKHPALDPDSHLHLSCERPAGSEQGLPTLSQASEYFIGHTCPS